MLASDNPTICGFEDNMFCGYTQDTTDTQGYNWSWKNGNTGTSFTGPTNDHTTNTLNGHYMYIETSTPRQPNDTTRFISPQYQVGTCLNLCFDRFNFEYMLSALILVNPLKQVNILTKIKLHAFAPQTLAWTATLYNVMELSF